MVPTLTLYDLLFSQNTTLLAYHIVLRPSRSFESQYAIFC